MSRATYRYSVVDVFSQAPLEGNALAVFLQAAELDPATMQKIARELNLAETVFVTPARRSDCVARLRIFTPRKEMDFAGHPTVGASFVLVQSGYVPGHVQRFAVEENVGAVSVSVEGDMESMFWLTTPPIQTGPTMDPDEAAVMLALARRDLLSCAPQVLSAGNPTLFVALKDPSAVDRAALDHSRWVAAKSRYQLGPMCVFVFAPTATGAYSRMFAPDYGIAEDPATGSSTGPLASYMLHHRLTSAEAGSRFVSEQGTQMGRRSLLHVRLHGEEGKDGIDVGGFVTPVIEAQLHI